MSETYDRKLQGRRDDRTNRKNYCVAAGREGDVSGREWVISWQVLGIQAYAAGGRAKMGGMFQQ